MPRKSSHWSAIGPSDNGDGEHADWLRVRSADGAFTLRGLVAELAESEPGRSLRADDRTMWAFAYSEGLSFKTTALASDQDRPDVARKRRRWKAHQGGVDIQRLAFIDEPKVREAKLGPRPT